MIAGGNATIFVSNMDAAVRFYTEVLGMKLTSRFENHWAEVDAGKGLTIGLHPASPKYPAPGTKGATMLGLETSESIERAVLQIQARGARMISGIERDGAGNFAHFEDPDGNEFYLWEVKHQAVPAPA